MSETRGILENAMHHETARIASLSGPEHVTEPHTGWYIAEGDGPIEHWIAGVVRDAMMKAESFTASTKPAVRRDQRRAWANEAAREIVALNGEADRELKRLVAENRHYRELLRAMKEAA